MNQYVLDYRIICIQGKALKAPKEIFDPSIYPHSLPEVTSRCVKVVYNHIWINISGIKYDRC